MNKIIDKVNNILGSILGVIITIFFILGGTFLVILILTKMIKVAIDIM